MPIDSTHGIYRDHLIWAQRHPALAQAVMAPLISRPSRAQYQIAFGRPTGAGDVAQPGRMPGKAIGKHRHLLHLPVPFAAQDGSGPERGGMSAQIQGPLSSLLRRPGPIEQTLTLPPSPQDDRPAAGTPGCETADGEQGEQAVAGRIRSANGCEARPTSRSRRRAISMSSFSRSGSAGPIFTRGMAVRSVGVGAGETWACRYLRSRFGRPGCRPPSSSRASA